MLKKCLQSFLDNLYEDRYNCLLCGREYPGDKFGLCEDCKKIIEINDGAKCIKCGQAIASGDGADGVCGNCSGKFRSFDKSVVPLIYKENVRKIVWNFKFSNCAYMGKYLARILSEGVINSGFLPVDAVVYVPLSRKSLKQRGYDQAEILAKYLSSYLDIPLLECLGKNEGAEQHELKRSDRQINVENMFFVIKEKKKDIKGKTLLLVDDIITTGSTCDAVASALKKAGAGKVYLAVLSGAEYKIDFEKE